MSTIVTRSGKGAALTHTEVDANFTNLNADKAEASAVIPAIEKGAASGVCPLDATSKVASTYLPSYVDDVLEYANYAALPATGETGKIYVALDTNKTYRWSGSAYVYITSGAVDSVAGKTGVVTLVKADVGLGNVDNTTDALKPISTATQTALDLKAPISSPTFTGTVSGVSKAMVGLGNVDNTTDIGKPVSTATQTALDLKSPLASPTLSNPTYTGTLTGSTGVLNIGSGQIYKDASGNVGIGTSNPESKLTITNNVTEAIPLVIKGGNPSLSPLPQFTGLAFGYGGAANYQKAGILFEFTVADGRGNLHFATDFTTTNSNVDLADARMTITGAGNVGIGTTAPSTKLTVAGAITITGAFALRGSYGGGAIVSSFAAGDSALVANTTGSENTASGVAALYSNTTGSSNTASGVAALYSNTTGSSNTASGVSALYYNTTGSNNVASGFNALNGNTTGSGNSAFNPINSAGAYAPVFNPTTQNDRFCMGSTGVTNAYIQVAWTVVSDARDKTTFAPVPHGLDFVNQLQPTAYQFKENRETDVATGIVRYGFKAQDILALEGDTPVIIDTEDLDKLRFNESSLIPVLVNAIKELTARLQILEAK